MSETGNQVKVLHDEPEQSDWCDICEAPQLVLADGSHACTKDINIQCAICDATEVIGGEVNERTLEDDGWELGPTENLCPDHANNIAEKDGGTFCGHCDEFTDHTTQNCVLPIVLG